jgi:predicted RNA binding protein YcfA (HicA-like mRNA interferase family)
LTSLNLMRFMKVIKTEVILRALSEDGWYIIHQKGSHRQFVHPFKKGKVTVNGKPSDDVWGSLLKSIENQSGLKF